MTAVAGLMMVSGCGTLEGAECLANDVGEVCAATSDGLIEFSGSGLTPDSEVLIDHSELTSDVVGCPCQRSEYRACCLDPCNRLRRARRAGTLLE